MEIENGFQARCAANRIAAIDATVAEIRDVYKKAGKRPDLENEDREPLYRCFSDCITDLLACRKEIDEALGKWEDENDF